jgi:hypothetical protein
VRLSGLWDELIIFTSVRRVNHPLHAGGDLGNGIKYGDLRTCLSSARYSNGLNPVLHN